jgi:hypothetical protein
MFLTSDPVPPGYLPKRRPSPPDLREFESAVREADKLAAPSLDEIRRRIESTGRRIETLREAVRRRK